MDILQTAASWHAGQDSALYSFVSTGRVWSEDHRAALEIEVQAAMRAVQQRPGAYQRDELDHLDQLLDYIRNAGPVEEGGR